VPARGGVHGLAQRESVWRAADEVYRFDSLPNGEYFPLYQLQTVRTEKSYMMGKKVGPCRSYGLPQVLPGSRFCLLSGPILNGLPWTCLDVVLMSGMEVSAPDHNERVSNGTMAHVSARYGGRRVGPCGQLRMMTMSNASNPRHEHQ
jgi:hypothetical protein